MRRSNETKKFRSRLQNCRRKRFLIVGIATRILIVATLAFLIPAQMKASEISKSLDLGEKYLDEGKYEEAILAYNDVITIDDKQVKACEANIGLKNYSEAETQLEAAKAISETDNGSLLLADVNLNTNRKDLGNNQYQVPVDLKSIFAHDGFFKMY